ncbi:MAG: acyloxyacyl hydrolase [Chlorobiales bacterium]|nr:acyloxyacyl hydrolase [Chlorobiales bacterium]
MKKSLAVLGAVITAGMLTVPAYAAESPSYYISGNVGPSWYTDINIRDPFTHNRFTVTTDEGINVMGALGVKWCDNYRVEAEVGYQRNNADRWNDDWGSHNISGHLSVTSVLANGYYDFMAGGINPYLTAGIGWASVGVNSYDLTNNFESHSVLGYQFGAGVSIPVAKNLDVDARYRYFRTSTVSLDYHGGDFQVASNSVLIGLRLGF